MGWDEKQYELAVMRATCANANDHRAETSPVDQQDGQTE